MSHDPTAPFHDLLALANTRHGPGGHYHVRNRADGPDHDHFADPEEGRVFLRDHDVVVPPEAPGAAIVRELCELRELTRALAGDRAADGAALEVPGEPVLLGLAAGRTYELGPDGRLRSTRDGWPGLVDRFVLDLLSLRESLDRLHVCANPACRFVFYDRSRNRSRLWCESAVCGNRVRVGRFRHRHAPDPGVAAG